MSIQRVNPYIHFNGTAEKAIQLYASALGAKTESVMHYGDMPDTCEGAPENEALVMHAVLRIGAGMVMLSDETPDHPLPAESNIQIALDFDDPAEMAKAFDALGAGGKVMSPLRDTFWGARFGMLTDPYGVRWMFNCQLAKP